jgi:glucokinase
LVIKIKKMRIKEDRRVVLSLDAGGTNLVFSAMQAGESIGGEFIIPAKTDTLKEFLEKLKFGFQTMINNTQNADAISFAFPGPADYPNGVIGKLENIPVFNDGVALGAWLEKEFKVPAFINNDGDLFSLGEAINGFLPLINRELKKNGNPKKYKQLIGITFGTGFGGGLVFNNKLVLGSNSAGGEINRMNNRLYPGYSAEESVSVRGIKRVYTREAAINPGQCPEPADIYKIAKGEAEGDQKAAYKSFEELAIVAADAIANAITLFDAPVVIGGGLSGAHHLILPLITKELNGNFKTFEGKKLDRMEVYAYNWNDPESRKDFLNNQHRKVHIPGLKKQVLYDPVKKICIGPSILGTSSSVAIGAYAYAISQLNALKKKQ